MVASQTILQRRTPATDVPRPSENVLERIGNAACSKDYSCMKDACLDLTFLTSNTIDNSKISDKRDRGLSSNGSTLSSAFGIKATKRPSEYCRERNVANWKRGPESLRVALGGRKKSASIQQRTSPPKFAKKNCKCLMFANLLIYLYK